MHVLRACIGIVVLLGLAYLLSSDRKKIDFKLVGSGIALQLVFAFSVLKIPAVSSFFDHISSFFVQVLDFTMAGSEFLFGGLVADTSSYGYLFAFQVLPTIIFFSALTSLLYYLGILQTIVYGFAWIMKRTMRLSGAESLAAAANIFLGQTEAPLMVKPYVGKMTRSEVLSLMTGGMATIAGGVMAAFVGYLGGDDPIERQRYATHLLTASIMSAPAALVIAKLLIPETEKVDDSMHISKEKFGKNILEAVSIGTSEGLKLAVNVGAMLLVFTALMAMLNFILGDIIGANTGINEQILAATGGKYESLSLQFILGYVFAPLAWIMGVESADITTVGMLLGEKTILNEFYAYGSLGQLKADGAFMSDRSIIISTYALCGFANFASIGIQIGGIGAIAPNKRTILSQLGIRALIGGTLAAFLTAAIAGMLI